MRFCLGKTKTNTITHVGKQNLRNTTFLSILLTMKVVQVKLTAYHQQMQRRSSTLAMDLGTSSDLTELTHSDSLS